MLNLKTIGAFCALIIMLLTFSGCSKEPETGKVIGYPVEKQSGHVFFLKEGWEKEWAQYSKGADDRFRTARIWLGHINAHIIPKKLDRLLAYITEEDLQSYRKEVVQITIDWNQKKEQKLHDLKRSPLSRNLYRDQIARLETAEIPMKELYKGVKIVKNKLERKVADNFMLEFSIEAAKYFIGSVPIDTDGTFRVLPDSASAVMVVQRKPKGFLNNPADSRLIVDTLLLDTNSEAVKNRGVIEFDYSLSLLDKKAIHLIKPRDEKWLMVEVLNKYYNKQG